MRQKSDASKSGFVDAARSYVLAIEAFRADNAGRVPVFGGNEWPDALKGPVNQLIGVDQGRRRLYMRDGVPDQMVSQNGTVSAAAVSGNANHIEYRALDRMKYALLVSTVGGDGVETCFLGSDPVQTDVSDSSEPFSCDKR